MEAHAREKDTAEWLSREYGGTATKSLFITVTSTDLETELSWPKVQRRIAQLIKDNRFLSEQEALPPRYQVVVYHHFENGFDEKLDYQTLADAEKAAQGYLDGTLEADGFAYEGAAIYDLQEKQYVRVFGDYPDPSAHADTIEADIDDGYSIFQTEQEQTDRMILVADLDLADTDLQDALTGDGGLLDYRGKDAVGGWFRAGESNAAVAQKLGDAYAGTAETMTLLSGETADYSKKYLAEHESDIIIHKASKKAFDELGLKKLPTVKNLQAEYAELLAGKKEAYAEYHSAQKEMRELLIHRQNIVQFLNLDMPAVQKEKEHDRG